MRAYQRFAKLTVDGVVGRTTWNSLYGKASILRVSGPVVTLKRLPYLGTPLAVGATGDAVLYYNLLLQRIAYYFTSVEKPPLSDQYTDETAVATRSAQELLGLPETGIPTRRRPLPAVRRPCWICLRPESRMQRPGRPWRP